MLNTDLVKEKISMLHEGDNKQLDIIFSDSPRLIVEAPAGYGKTTTMISRIAYLFVTGGIPNPKRILGLTFSVNAALKVKREIAEKLPKLLNMQNCFISLEDKVTVTNYHGFCKGILKKYGYLVTDTLRKDVNLFRAVGDSEICKKPDLKNVLSFTELQSLESVEQSIKDACVPDVHTIIEYNNIVVKKLLPFEYITHNAVILLVLDLFDRFPEVRKFYQSYYPVIVVDEFQDTNCIAWDLLKSLITEETKLIFLGDPLQRIYGFIGALPNIMNTAAEKYHMTQVTLAKNYRFRNNTEMLKLDANIRANAASCFAPTMIESAQLPMIWADTQQSEASQIVEKVNSIISTDGNRVAILFRGRGKNAEIIEEELSKRGIPYFYGMFTEDDSDYVEFHNKCQKLFIKKFGKAKSISKRALISFSENVKKICATMSGKTIDSLLHLLDALIEKISVDYSDLAPEDKYSLLIDIFENKQLKQAMEYVDSPVILSTVHGAKGLEWDFVILADMERWIFPGYYTCKNCPNRYAAVVNCKCRLPDPIPAEFKNIALDELSVFYVGVTRARKQVFVSASAKRINNYGAEKSSNVSCLPAINGIQLIKA